jgi:hypothetical protein
MVHGMSQRLKTIALVLGSGLVGSLLTGTAYAQMQGNMVNARASINQGIGYLQAAQSDKGGHRTNAINLARQAVREINLGIGYANRH